MKEDMLEVLIYLFENYIIDDVIVQPGHRELEQELNLAGFDDIEIDKAFDWLEGMLDIFEQKENQPYKKLANNTIRTYTNEERARLTLDGESLLIRLMNVGVLDQFTREMVIDRVMALDSPDIELEHIKWVVLMILSSQPNFEEMAHWAEIMVSGDMMPTFH